MNSNLATIPAPAHRAPRSPARFASTASRMQSHTCPTRLLLNCSPHAPKFLPKSCPNPPQLLPKCAPDDPQMLPRCSPNAPPPAPQGAARCPTNASQNGPRMLPESFPNASQTLSEIPHVCPSPPQMPVPLEQLFDAGGPHETALRAGHDRTLAFAGSDPPGR